MITTNNEQRICAAESAITAGLSSDPAGVRESCLHIEAGRWRDECVFMATERMYQSMGDRVLPQVAWLCAHAGGYSHHCLKRIINANQGAVPAADSESGWNHIVGRATAIQTGIEQTDPILARQVVDWYYAEVMDLSYAKASVIQGRPLGRLPAKVHPHVRAAAIDRLVRSSPIAQRTIEEWMALIDHTMASHSPLASPVSPMAAVTDRWGYEEPTEANVRSIYWRGSARRMLSDDPASDRLICLMETLARTNRSASHELENLHDHPSEAVRLTATRLSYVVASNGN